MKYGMVLLALGVIGTTGCQKAIEQQDLQMLQAASVCPQPMSIDGDVQLIGQASTNAGAPVNYSLQQNGNCVSSDNVSWKAVGSSKSYSSAKGLTSLFQRSGSYVVTARTPMKEGDQTLSMLTTVVKDQVKLVGPQAGFSFNPLDFTVVTPDDMEVSSIAWNFGGGTVDEIGNANISHTFFEEGQFMVTVKVTDTKGNVKSSQLRVTIMSMIDDMSCITDLRISGADEAKVDVATNMYVYLPACLASQVGAVTWSFGDSNSGHGQNVDHTYTAEGQYDVQATLYLVGSQNPWVVLDHHVKVTKELVIDPEPPVDPMQCKVDGETRQSQGDIYTKEVACGLDGKKIVSYRDTVTEECKLVVESLQWVEVSRDPVMTQEGACEGQSCKLPDGSVLADGLSKVMYSDVTPAGTCQSVSEIRTCANGELTGSTTHTSLICHEGCGDFGSHGTIKTEVITGEVKLPLQCKFQEEGFFDIFNQVSDQVCKDGVVVDTNTRQGSIKVAGNCPTYEYKPTDKWSACDADCGGQQNRTFTCVDEKGGEVAADRCAGIQVPVETRLCDANPEAVRREDVSSVTEEANSSASCPKNQIGVIMNIREVVTTKTYACINHSVQLANEVTVPGAWVEEKYCRDYVPRRCSHDSLSNSQAEGRYKWMLKCEDELPIIKEFLTSFADVSIKKGNKEIALDGKMLLYPTFMDRAYSPEKPWIAPTKESAACTMPSTVYVAAVCVASCATPEQQLIVEDVKSKKMNYSSFLDALTKNAAYVGTLKNSNSMASSSIAKVKVENWVTELLDTEHQILVFKMKSGRELRLTKNHPILTKEGMMKSAEDFKAGESLVQIGGKLDPIVSIQEIKYFGKVYNVFVQSSELHKNIVVTNGYLNGTAYFQNEGAKDLNRKIFRNNLTQGVFGK